MPIHGCKQVNASLFELIGKFTGQCSWYNVIIPFYPQEDRQERESESVAFMAWAVFSLVLFCWFLLFHSQTCIQFIITSDIDTSIAS